MRAGTGLRNHSASSATTSTPFPRTCRHPAESTPKNAAFPSWNRTALPAAHAAASARAAALARAAQTRAPNPPADTPKMARMPRPQR